jgi:hypothetical protein
LTLKLEKYIWLLLGLVGIILCAVETPGESDFGIYISAAIDLSDQKDIYQTGYYDGYHYYYSVFFALFLKLFTGFNFSVIKFIWLYFNFLCFIHLLYLLSDLMLKLNVNLKQRRVLISFAIIFCISFVIQNIHNSQITLFLLWASIYGLKLIYNEKIVSGSILIALAVNIKIMPVVILPVLFFNGRWKSLMLIMFFYLALLFFPYLVIDWDYYNLLLNSWLNLINPFANHHILDVDERSFHSLTTLLSTLLVEETGQAYKLPYKRNILDVNIETLKWIILGVRLFFISCVFLFLNQPFFKKNYTFYKTELQYAFVLALVPLIFPHQQHYPFVLCLPIALLCLYYYLILKKKWMIFSLIIVFLCFNLRLLLGHFNNYYEHYKIITYGALILVFMAMYIGFKIKRDPLVLNQLL